MSKQPLIDQMERAISRILANPDAAPETSDAEIVELLSIARDLRTLPSPGFKSRVRTELERKTQMSTKTVVFRAGFRTVTPYLLPPGPEYVDFLKSVFGAEETERTQISPGRFHAEFRIGDSMLMLGVGSGMTMPTSLELSVPDVDDVYKRAIEAGCKELEAVYDAHWEGGLRLGVLQDPAGNAWVIATHRGGNYIPEGRNSLSASLVAAGAAQLVDFMKHAFDAKEVQRYEWPGGLYAAIRVGDSVVGVSEASNHEWMQPMPSMIYMYVPDCDALYQQALSAGATSMSAPANQSYGDRSAGVKDAWGNIWYLSTPQ
jgi:PhnB protein